jgi:hypothetical protein
MADTEQHCIRQEFPAFSPVRENSAFHMSAPEKKLFQPGFEMYRTAETDNLLTDG